MRSIQTQSTFPLSSVKPLEKLAPYREQCLEATRRACGGKTRRRERSPATWAALEPAGRVEELEYSRCPQTGSLFLTVLPEPGAWSKLLREAAQFRRSPEAFHQGLVHSRLENVHRPKLEWIQETLRLQGVSRPRLLEAVTPPSELTPFLREDACFSEVLTADEMELAHGAVKGLGVESVQAAALLESLDRVDEPEGLLRETARLLCKGGLLFVTGLVGSGFDLAVLALRNRYLYPPDRANCFTLQGLKGLLERSGFEAVEVSTPGVLDVQIVEEHLRADPELKLPPFEEQVLASSPEARAAFQMFLQEWGMSSFARIVARKSGTGHASGGTFGRA